MILKYVHALYKDVYFTDNPSTIPTGYTASGMTASDYSEEKNITNFVNAYGVYHCYEHNLHTIGSPKITAQWFRDKSEIVWPNDEMWS